MDVKRLGMEKIGLSDVKDVHRNLPGEVLVDHIVNNQEGRIGLRGAAMVDTGIYTGRSPDDKYIVDEASSNDKIWWGPVNRKVNEDVFNELYEKATGFYNSSTSRTYMFDGFAGKRVFSLYYIISCRKRAFFLCTAQQIRTTMGRIQLYFLDLAVRVKQRFLRIRIVP